MERKYVKLKDLVGSEFTVTKVWPYKWKMWDNDNRKMLVSDDYVQGYRKIYGVETDKGTMDLGPGQISSLLEAVFYDGRADINNRTFTVKSNGKDGMDIRYFFNAKAAQKAPETVTDPMDEPINLDNVPFPK